MKKVAFGVVISLCLLIPLFCFSSSALTSITGLPNYPYGIDGGYVQLIPDSMYSGLCINNVPNLPLFMSYTASDDGVSQISYNVAMRGFTSETTTVIFLFPASVLDTQYNVDIRINNMYMGCEMMEILPFQLGYNPSTNNSNTNMWKMLSEVGNIYSVPDIFAYGSVPMVSFGFRCYKYDGYIGNPNGDILISFNFTTLEWPEHVSQNLPQNIGSPIQAGIDYLNHVTQYLNRIGTIFECDALRDVGFVICGGLIIGLICKFTI